MSIIYEWKATKNSGKNTGIEGYDLTWQTDDASASVKDIVTSTLGPAVSQAKSWGEVNFGFDIDEVDIKEKEATEDDFYLIYRGALYHLNRKTIETK